MLRLETGIWRSLQNDSSRHAGVKGGHDGWPQAAHVVSDAPALVLCAAGAGGGSQQAMFRRDLLPLLESAYERWRASFVVGTAAAIALEQLFAEIQRGFESLQQPLFARES